MHYAFAMITADFKVDISQSEDQLRMLPRQRCGSNFCPLGGGRSLQSGVCFLSLLLLLLLSVIIFDVVLSVVL